jgi:hypothetical protein
MQVEKFIKLPDAKWLVYVITGGAIILVAAKVIDTIYSAKIHKQQNKIYKYIIAEYVAKYGDIDANTFMGQIDNLAGSISANAAKII